MKILVFISLAVFVLPIFAGADTVRAAVGKPLQQAEILIQKHDFQAALKKTKQASAIAGLTPYESLIIAQVRGSAAAGAGDYAQAAGAYQTVLASGSEPKATQLQLIQAISGFYYQAKDYPHAAIWVSRYIDVGGSDAQTRALLAQSYYQEADYRHAEQSVWQEQKAAQDTHRTVAESQLQLLANSAEKSGDKNGYTLALDALLTTYQNSQYWAEAIANVVQSRGFPDRLILDVYRLRVVTNTLTDAGDYEDYAERAILVGQPDEAKSIIDKGFSSGILTEATDSGHAARLRTLADKDTETDAVGLSDRIQEAKSGIDSFGLIDTGVDLVDQGRSSQGISLIQSGIEKGGMAYPEDASLDLGIAYLTAGYGKNAIQSFRKITDRSTLAGQGQDAEIALAKLWLIYAENLAGR